MINSKHPSSSVGAQAYGNQQLTEQLLACDAPPIIQIPHRMKAPIFIYYELGNYFQNHRRCSAQNLWFLRHGK